jgi:glycosyltransferase involved in cell wall biosynthesis
MPDLSIVVPLHNEAANVRPLVSAVLAAVRPLGRPFEILLVDDGSTDATPTILANLAGGNPRLHPVYLEGNFGQAAALCAGFEAASGSVVLTLDGDLQNDPADLPRLLAMLEEGDYRVVSGWRGRRHGSYARRVLPSRIANWLISALTGLPTRDNGCSLKAYRRDVVSEIYLPHGMHRFIPAVFGIHPEEFGQIEVSDRPRASGRSHYGLLRFIEVLRELLTIRFIMRGHAGEALCLMNLLIGAGIVGLGAGELLGRHQASLGLTFTGADVCLLAYAIIARGNLIRWLEAQKDGTFRVRRTKPLREARPELSPARRHSRRQATRP